jgi:hypothetical protein
VTSSTHRKRRGAATQALAAEWFRNHGFPYCTDAGAGRIGRDLLNLIGLAGEIKARSDFNPLAWVRQALANADGDVPFVIVRCNGQGSATVADWPVILRLEDFTRLVRLAGYGDPISDEETA